MRQEGHDLDGGKTELEVRTRPKRREVVTLSGEDEERRYITPRQAALIYGFAVGYLANLRTDRKGPGFYKCGRKILYKVSEFEAWITANPVKTIDSLAV